MRLQALPMEYLNIENWMTFPKFNSFCKQSCKIECLAKSIDGPVEFSCKGQQWQTYIGSRKNLTGRIS